MLRRSTAQLLLLAATGCSRWHVGTSDEAIDAGPDGGAEVDCGPVSEQEFCADVAAQCGIVDGTDACGVERSVDCGGCGRGETCSKDHACVPGCGSTDTDVSLCAANQLECGTHEVTDNCGVQRTVGCAECGGDTICTDAGRCSEPRCVPETDEAYCKRLGRSCGPALESDNCGALRNAECGTCEAPAACGRSGTCIAQFDCAGPSQTPSLSALATGASLPVPAGGEIADGLYLATTITYGVAAQSKGLNGGSLSFRDGLVRSRTLVYTANTGSALTGYGELGTYKTDGPSLLMDVTNCTYPSSTSRRAVLAYTATADGLVVVYSADGYYVEYTRSY